MALYRHGKEGAVVHAHPLRVLACLIVLLMHCAILGTSVSAGLWSILLLHTLLYPHLIHLFTKTEKDERRNILLDNFAYGASIAIWGFNPLVTVAMISSATMSNFSAGGLRLLFVGTFSMLLGMVIVSAVYGFYFREYLSLFATILVCSALYIYMLSLGGMFYKVNQKLIRVKNRLAQQKETLQDISELAQRVNTHLELDEIMKPVLATLRQMYSFEQVYLTSLSDDGQWVHIERSYGDYVSGDILGEVVGIGFSTREEAKSIFVWPLLKDRQVYIPRAERPNPDIAPPIDMELYELKAPISVAYFPLHVENKVIGGFAIFNYEKPLELDELAFHTIGDYLVQVGTAIRNARLLERERVAREQATQAQHAAEESEKAKSRFLANMSHEIRTPMTAILGYAESLLDQDISLKERRQFAGTIIRSGFHLLTIINDILDISKIEADQLEVERIDINIANILEELRSHLGMRASEKALSFSITPVYPLPKTFVSDPTRLKQILFNLGANAIKFTHRGKIDIRVAYDNAHHLLSFAIEDTGIGMTQEELDRVFEPFVQADSSTTRQYGGTGLGLHISRELARLLGGQIIASSSKGQGSCFVVTIDPGPMIGVKWITCDEELEQATETTSLEADLIIPQLQGKVLLAEDNPDNQHLISRLLGQAGLDVSIVNNGRAAIEAMEKERFDLILLDIQMPEMGGEDTARQLVRIHPRVPLIAITANVMKHQVEDYLSVGFDDYIAKPINRRVFYQIISEHLRPKTYAKSCNILIVEDNATNQLLLKRQVESAAEHAEIKVAVNGDEAVNIASSQPQDLIIMDIQMPVMDGMEALKILRGQGYTQPIYMLSGNASISDIQASLEAGANGHLCKPVSRDELRQVLFRHLG